MNYLCDILCSALFWPLAVGTPAAVRRSPCLWRGVCLHAAPSLVPAALQMLSYIALLCQALWGRGHSPIYKQRQTECETERQKLTHRSASWSLY